MSNYYERNGQQPAAGAPQAGKTENAAPGTGVQNGAAGLAAPGTQQNQGVPGAQQQRGAPYSTTGGELGKQLGEGLQSLVTGVGSVVVDVTKNLGAAARDVAGDISREAKTQAAQHKVQQGKNGYNYSYNYNYNLPRKGQKQTPPWYGKPVVSPSQKPTNYAGVAQITLGTIGVGFFGFSSAALAMVGFTAGVVGFGVLALGSAAMFVGGVTSHKYTTRLLAYQSALMKQNVLTFAQLAKTTSYPEAQVRKDFRKGLRKNKLKYVYLDKKGDTVMLGDNTYNYYLQQEELREKQALEAAERARLMEENPEFAQMEQFRTESGEMLAKIRAANEAIPGEEVSAKLDKLEETSAKIFAFVETHPHKLQDTRKFMNYYLPTTLKVVDKYREYEEMEAQSPSIVKTREEIENSLDTINTAFDNLFDELCKDDTLDIATDIEVLHSMLEQEGLTGKKFKIEVEPNTKI